MRSAASNVANTGTTVASRMQQRINKSKGRDTRRASDGSVGGGDGSDIGTTTSDAGGTCPGDGPLWNLLTTLGRGRTAGSDAVTDAAVEGAAAVAAAVGAAAGAGKAGGGSSGYRLSWRSSRSKEEMAALMGAATGVGKAGGGFRPSRRFSSGHKEDYKVTVCTPATAASAAAVTIATGSRGNGRGVSMSASVSNGGPPLVVSVVATLRSGDGRYLEEKAVLEVRGAWYHGGWGGSGCQSFFRPRAVVGPMVFLCGSSWVWCCWFQSFSSLQTGRVPSRRVSQYELRKAVNARRGEG